MVKKQLDANKQFENVILSDECTVQLDQHARVFFCKEKEKRALKQPAKHPVKVHIWGGISIRGATKIVIFSGKMNAIEFGKILEASLVPFVQVCYPDGHRLQMDNAPKHSSKYISWLMKLVFIQTNEFTRTN